MRVAWVIARRELAAYFKTPLGYAVAFVIMMMHGLYFYVFRWGPSTLSTKILESYFESVWGAVAFAGLLLSMGLFADERQNGTLVLLQTAPIREWQVILGKWIACFVMVVAYALVTLYMPLMVWWLGSVNLGHIVAGYVGVIGWAACVSAIGTWGSALGRNHILSLAVSGPTVILLILMWLLARKVEAPLNDVFSYLSLYDKHWAPSFQRGRINVADFVFYVSLAGVFLVGASKVSSSRRWVG